MDSTSARSSGTGPASSQRHGPVISILDVSRCSVPIGESVGGADITAARHAEALCSSSVEVTYVGTPASDPPRGVEYIAQPAFAVNGRDRDASTNGVVTHFVSLLVSNMIGVLRGSLLGLTRRFDVVIAHSSIGVCFARLTLVRLPIIYHFHDSLYEDRPDLPLAKRLFRIVTSHIAEKVALKLAAGVVCNSERVALQLERYGVPGSKLVAVSPIADFTPTVGSATGSGGGAPMPRDSASPYILSVGQQLGRKRFDLLIRALPLLSPEVRLILVGHGPLNVEYRRLAGELGVSERVEFCTDLTSAQLTALYEGATLFALVSEQEGFPLTSAEALLHGCPLLLCFPTAPTDWHEFASFLEARDFVPEEREVAALIGQTLARVGTMSTSDRQRIAGLARERLLTASEVRERYLKLFARVLPKRVSRRLQVTDGVHPRTPEPT